MKKQFQQFAQSLGLTAHYSGHSKTMFIREDRQPISRATIYLIQLEYKSITLPFKIA